MKTNQRFEIPVAGRFDGAYLAQVVSVNDPDNLSRVQLRLLNFDGFNEQDAPIWARVAVPFAGANRGAFLLPDVDDEVVVNFINGDSRFPIVIGGLWNGSDSAPEQLGGSGNQIDRWTFVGKAGTRIAIVEETNPTISLTTPGGVSLEMTDEGGGKIELQVAGTTVTIDTSGMSVQTPSTFKVQASQIEKTSGQVTVNAAMSKFSGFVTCDVAKASTMISTVYTPGAGNIW